MVLYVLFVIIVHTKILNDSVQSAAKRIRTIRDGNGPGKRNNKIHVSLHCLGFMCLASFFFVCKCTSHYHSPSLFAIVNYTTRSQSNSLLDLCMRTIIILYSRIMSSVRHQNLRKCLIRIKQ